MGRARARACQRVEFVIGRGVGAWGGRIVICTSTSACVWIGDDLIPRTSWAFTQTLGGIQQLRWWAIVGVKWTLAATGIEVKHVAWIVGTWVDGVGAGAGAGAVARYDHNGA